MSAVMAGTRDRRTNADGVTLDRIVPVTILEGSSTDVLADLDLAYPTYLARRARVRDLVIAKEIAYSQASDLLDFAWRRLDRAASRADAVLCAACSTPHDLTYLRCCDAHICGDDREDHDRSCAEYIAA
jgi:hypothetical protein